MKHITAFLLCVIGVASVYGDQATRERFNGLWTGAITIDGGERTINIRIEIREDKIIQYFSGNGGSWRAVEPDDDHYLYDRNNLVYGWVNKGGIWSETQIYSLSFINNRTLSVVWLRHVNNFQNGSDNEDWNLTGKGRLTRTAPIADRYENDDTAPRAKEIMIDTPQERTFTTSSDVDWVKFTVRRAGNYVIRAVGAASSLDTVLELYTYEQDPITSDDDGGERLDARISRRLEVGTYLIRVRCLDEAPNDSRYTLSVRQE